MKRPRIALFVTLVFFSAISIASGQATVEKSNVVRQPTTTTKTYQRPAQTSNKKALVVPKGTVGVASSKTQSASGNTAAVGSNKEDAGSVTVTYPNGGEEIVAGTVLDIKWNSKDAGNKVAIMLMAQFSIASASAAASVVQDNPALNAPVVVPMVITQNAPNTGSYKYRVPAGINSRFGSMFKILVKSEGAEDTSDKFFQIYPEVDLAPINIRIKNKKKKKDWLLGVVSTVLLGGATGMPTVIASTATPGLPAAYVLGIKRIVEYNKKDNKPLSHKHPIQIDFDLVNWGTKIVNQTIVTNVAVKLDPGGAELNSGGFPNSRIIPPRKYHNKTTIDPKDWEITAGKYRLEIWVDPQNNANEPEALRANNKRTVSFTVN
jgi:hypothetical protein